MTAEKQKRNTTAHDGQNLTENTMQIDKDIPLPPLSSSVRRKHHDLYALIESMQVGDSFLVPERLLYRGVFSNKHLLEQKYGIKLAQRKTSEGVRIWRTA